MQDTCSLEGNPLLREASHPAVSQHDSLTQVCGTSWATHDGTARLSAHGTPHMRPWLSRKRAAYGISSTRLGAGCALGLSRGAI